MNDSLPGRGILAQVCSNMGNQCTGCGIEATEGESFQPVERTFRRPGLLCPNCQAAHVRRTYLGLLVAYLGVGAIGVALVTWLPGNVFGRFFLNLFLSGPFAWFRVRVEARDAGRAYDCPAGRDSVDAGTHLSHAAGRTLD